MSEPVRQVTAGATLTALDGSPLGTLTFSNDDGHGFRWSPERFLLTADTDAWRSAHATVDSLTLGVPQGWHIIEDPCQPLDGRPTVNWTVIPGGTPSQSSTTITLLGLTAAERVAEAHLLLPVVLRGQSQFDPRRDALSFANSTFALGQLGPRRDVFDRTYGLVPAASALFNGLYRAIVFIGGDVRGYGGGLCSGMARAALERSLTGHGSEPAIEQVMLWHGRQLTDRALLSSAGWFFKPSPRRAYLRFRDEVIGTGRSDVCFDIRVPRPLRRDIASALMQEGHTVVPYAFRQSDDIHAEVLVYDPNHPEPESWPESVIRFDLTADTYAYRQLVSLDDRSTTIIAARQSAYRNGRSAILATLASLVLFPQARSGRLSGKTLAGAAGVTAIAASWIARRRRQ
jgi:hypothetical protein